MSRVSFVVALSLLVAQFTRSQTYDDLCVIRAAFLHTNGLYSFEGESLNGKRLYHRQSTPQDNCIDTYLLWRDDHWVIASTPNESSFTYYARCAAQDPTQCDGAWSDPSQVFADSCPEWDCDYINIPDAPDTDCRAFDVKSVDEGSNVWYSTANDRYWYFSFLLLEWVCAQELTSYSCSDWSAGSRTDNGGWIDLDRGQTREIVFEDLSVEGGLVSNSVSASVECGATTNSTPLTTSSATTTTTADMTSSLTATDLVTEASLDTAMTTHTTTLVEAEVNGNGDPNTVLSTLALVFSAVGLCLLIVFVAVCYRNWRAKKVRNQSEKNVQQSPDTVNVPTAAPQIQLVTTMTSFDDHERNKLFPTRAVVQANVLNRAENSNADGRQNSESNAQSEQQFAQLLKAWGLGKFIDRFEEEGWTDVRAWNSPALTHEDLLGMGLKRGHINTFRLKYTEMSAPQFRMMPAPMAVYPAGEDDDDDSENMYGQYGEQEPEIETEGRGGAHATNGNGNNANANAPVLEPGHAQPAPVYCKGKNDMDNKPTVFM